MCTFPACETGIFILRVNTHANVPYIDGTTQPTSFMFNIAFYAMLYAKPVVISGSVWPIAT
jgi:hypothetical protein